VQAVTARAPESVNASANEVEFLEFIRIIPNNNTAPSSPVIEIID